MIKRFNLVACIVFGMAFIFAANAQSAMNFKVGESGEISFGGYMENFSGLRVGQEGKGKCTAFRSTFNPEFLFKFSREARLFASGRFVREMGYELEDNVRADMGLDPLPDDYYNETDFESYELYLDVDLSPSLHVRTGKQFIIWGETDVFTLLDVVCPSDSSWISPGIMALEETRIPQYAARVVYDLSILTNLEFVFVPMIDDAENRVNKGSPTGGRWAPHPEDRPGGAPHLLYPNMMGDLAEAGFNPADGDQIGAASVFKRTPESDLDQARVGVRLMTQVGRMTLTFADFYGHNYSPVVHYGGIKHEVKQELVEEPTGNAAYQDVNYYTPQFSVRYKRQNILGGSFNYFDDKIFNAVFRGEVAYYPNKPYNTFDPREKNAVTEKDTISYMLGFDKEFFVPWLNPWDPYRTLFVSGQMFQDVILASDDDLRFINYKTPIEKTTTRFTLLANTSFLSDTYKPELIIAYDVAGNGMIRPRMTWKPPWSEKYYVELTYVNYWGHQYEWLGFYKEKDSVFLRVRYMW